jgi:uncharacterized membrane protein
MWTPETKRRLRELGPWIALVGLAIGLAVAFLFEDPQGWTMILALVYVLAGLLTGLAERDE